MVDGAPRLVVPQAADGAEVGPPCWPHTRCSPLQHPHGQQALQGLLMSTVIPHTTKAAKQHAWQPATTAQVASTLVVLAPSGRPPVTRTGAGCRESSSWPAEGPKTGAELSLDSPPCSCVHGQAQPWLAPRHQVLRAEPPCTGCSTVILPGPCVLRDPRPYLPQAAGRRTPCTPSPAPGCAAGGGPPPRRGSDDTCTRARSRAPPAGNLRTRMQLTTARVTWPSPCSSQQRRMTCNVAAACRASRCWPHIYKCLLFQGCISQTCTSGNQTSRTGGHIQHTSAGCAGLISF